MTTRAKLLIVIVAVAAVVTLTLFLAPAIARAQETASDTLLTVNHYLDWEQVSDSFEWEIGVTPSGGHRCT